jgi:hypothetical protein
VLSRKTHRSSAVLKSRQFSERKGDAVTGACGTKSRRNLLRLEMLLAESRELDKIAFAFSESPQAEKVWWALTKAYLANACA